MNTDGTQNIPAGDAAQAEGGALTRRQALTTAARTVGAGLLLLLPMAREAAHADPAPAPAAPATPGAAPAAPAPAAPDPKAPTVPAVPPDTSTWTSLGKAALFVKGQPLRTALPNGDVLYVTRLTADTFDVVSARCTHRGCEVGYSKDASQFVCPCHGAVFATSGKSVHGTSRHPDELLPALPSVPVVQKKGEVLANLKAVPAPALIPGH